MSFERLAHALLTGRPYFGMALRARQGWISRHAYFRPIMRAVRRQRPVKSLRILEVGSWAGSSSVSWAKTMQHEGVAGSVLCVDAWKPYFDLELESGAVYSEMNAAAASGEIMQLFQHNVRASGVADYIQCQRGNSRDVLPRLPSGAFDIIFLDGSHQHHQVAFDIAQARRLVADGGIICGDDLELQRDEIPTFEHTQAVRSARDFVRCEAANESYHPGVTEAVADAFGHVAVWEGLWAVMRHGDAWGRVELDLSRRWVPPHLTGDVEPEALTAQSDDAHDQQPPTPHERLVC